MRLPSSGSLPGHVAHKPARAHDRELASPDCLWAVGGRWRSEKEALIVPSSKNECGYGFARPEIMLELKHAIPNMPQNCIKQFCRIHVLPLDYLRIATVIVGIAMAESTQLALPVPERRPDKLLWVLKSQ